MHAEDTQKAKWRPKAAAFPASHGISLIGSQIVQMAMIWHVTLKTSSGVCVTILTLAAFLPQMIISLFGGVWADRYNRKHLILASFLLALFMIPEHADNDALPAIIIVAAIRSLGSGITPFFPAGRQPAAPSTRSLQTSPQEISHSLVQQVQARRHYYLIRK